MKIDKISFLPYGSDNFFGLMESLSEEEREAAEEIVDFYVSGSQGAEFAFAVVSGNLLIRAYAEEEYSFLFPYEITDGADISSAILRIVEYAALEEIEPIFEAVPTEYTELFSELGFRHIRVEPDSADEESRRVQLMNELSLFEGELKASLGALSLSQIEDSDAVDYARLWRDEENNKYWGYDFREDHADADDGFFVELARRELSSASALSLAVRSGNTFVGEALLSCFDYKGGADLSIRILPDFQRMGYAKATFEMLRRIASEIGLVKLYARVYEENIPSIRLFEAKADEKRREDDILIFTYYL